MSDVAKRAAWRKHVKRLFAIFVVYAVTVLLSGVAHPSVRLAKSVKIDADVRMSTGGDIFQGDQSFFGWPIRFLTLRREADRPIGSEGTRQMRIVTARFGWRALAINASSITSIYCLVVIVSRVAMSHRFSMQGAVVSVICLGALSNVWRLRDREFLEPIAIYEDE